LVISRDSSGNVNQVFSVFGAGTPINILATLTSNVREALQLCSTVNENSGLTAENGLPYSGITQEPVVGEGTNRIMCASASHAPSLNRFAWLRLEAGTYN